MTESLAPGRLPPAGDDPLAATDPEIAQALEGERLRQAGTLSLVASESPPSAAVQAASASVLGWKYAEGLPGLRQCAGCAYGDEVEALARSRLMSLFGAGYANVQPHSATTANLAAYLALCRPGDTIVAPDPACGGHSSHGGPAGLASRLYRFVPYGVERGTERVDLDAVEALVRRERPALLVAGAGSHPRSTDFAGFGRIAQAWGARLLADLAHGAGLVAAALVPSPLPHADVVALATHKTLRGPHGGALLCRAEDAKAVDRAVYPGVQGGPLLHTIAAKAVAFREAGTPEFARWARATLENAAELARVLAGRGYRLTSGGTDTHLLILDLRVQGLSGRQAERALEAVGITANRQPVPFDPYPPPRSSGLRLGTPSVTARGMGPGEMAELGGVIADVLEALLAGPANAAAVALEAGRRVSALAERFPAG